MKTIGFAALLLIAAAGCPKTSTGGRGMLDSSLIVFAAKYLFLLLPVIAFIWFIRLSSTAKKEAIVLGLITGIVALALGRLVALFFFDPRPFVVGHFTPLIPHAPDNGFPSDHTLLSAAIAMTVFLRNRRIGALLWLLVLVVGAGRIASGLHSPIDVAGSIAFSVIGGLVGEFVVRRVWSRRAQ